MATQMSSDVMRDTFKLPKLVGNGFQQEMMRKNFRKRQVMQPLTGPKPVGVDRIPVDFESIKIAKEMHAGSDAREEDPVSLDRKVLRFTGYFKEGVHESRWETERVRKCVIHYFLEDHTISVSEPREDNSGMSQGCMLKRHQIPKEEGGPGGYYTYEDLNVGAIITFYGKTFRLCDCDEFTRDFLETLGVEVHDAIPFPDDAYQSQRAAKPKKPIDPEDRNLKAVMECHYSGKRSRLSPEELQAAKQFLKMDGKVLKFKARWDDSEALYGDVRNLTVYYFLADDTLEVTEDYAVNAGRDPFPSFARRRKCVKPAGKFENKNASLSFAKAEQEFYTDEDLYVGAVINVFGRMVHLTSCDKFTEDYLRMAHEREPVAPLQVEKPAAAKPKPVPPPYNGYGDEEDSLGSWKNLVLKPPKKDVKRYIDKSALMLKFNMKLDSTDPANDVRRFVLTYYISDDTISIFEPAQRNSGIIGGKFLQRSKGKHSDTGLPIKPEDLYIGARVEIHSHKFILFATDEKSLCHMEQNSSDFARSNINRIMAKLRAMLLSQHTNLQKAIREVDANKNGGIDYEELAGMLTSLGLPVDEQEVLTVLRYLDVNRDGSITYDEFMHVLLPDGNANTVDLPWQKIYAQTEAEELVETQLPMRETIKFKQHAHTAAGAAALKIMDKFENRRGTLAHYFSKEASRARDDKVGEKEFKLVVANMNVLDEAHLRFLAQHLFTEATTRLAVQEIVRALEATSKGK